MIIIYALGMLFGYAIPVNMIKAIKTQDEEKSKDYIFLSGVCSALLVFFIIAGLAGK